MIVHLLRFAFKESTTPEQLAENKKALTRLATSRWTSFAVVGQDLGDPAEGYTLSYCVGFKDLEALKGYFIDEPLHPAADRQILPHVKKMTALDISDDDDPALREKIGELVQEKIRRQPEFVRLMSAINQQ